ncbi:MAG TPA: winged helix-turn-helix domain-containing protein [Novosphingobium sp.]|nr:winged helix-turn-helix domain-containing protein [Novosphingobium sp.]
MGQFGWLGTDRIPTPLDLRALGWTLAAVPATPASSPFPLLLSGLARALAIRSPQVRARVILAEIHDSTTRAHLLALGFGEVTGAGLALEELAGRAARLSATLENLPRRRKHGPMTLDLLHREGWVGRHRLGLHPREFALLWRLAESPGEPVSPGTLLHEVWQLSHRPETNSLAVHVCRLRAKLASAGLPHLLHTCPGGYILADKVEPALFDSATNRVALPDTCG